jgi:hypothetical protein
MSISDPDNPHCYLEVRGDVERIEPDPTASYFLRLSDRYGTGPRAFTQGAAPTTPAHYSSSPVARRGYVTRALSQHAQFLCIRVLCRRARCMVDQLAHWRVGMPIPTRAPIRLIADTVVRIIRECRWLMVRLSLVPPWIHCRLASFAPGGEVMW